MQDILVLQFVSFHTQMDIDPIRDGHIKKGHTQNYTHKFKNIFVLFIENSKFI